MSGPLHTQNEAKREANRKRTEWLLSLSAGYVTPADLIKAACTEENRALLRLTLRQVLVNQPGWGDVRATRVLSRLRRVLGEEQKDSRRMTVAWLVDSRAGGKRIQVWADALDNRSSLPWPGFPHAPQPEKGAGNGQ